MRLLMTTDTVGGVWTYSCDLVEEMLKRGFEVMLVVVGRAPSLSQAAWIKTASERWGRNFTARRVDASLEWMEDGGGCYANSKAEMLKICEEFRPEIVHCNQFCYGALPIDAVKIVVAHSDVLSWWEARYGERMPASAWRTRYCELLQSGVAGADAVIAPTAAALAGFALNFEVPRDTRVIANGRTTRCTGLSDTDVLAGKRMQAVTCGRVWDEGKQVRLLEEARAPLPVLIAGERTLARDVSDARTQATNCDAAGQVHYLGALSADALEQLLLESAIYVVTSRYEPFGLAAVEATLAGCAVVANDIASQREVWGDAAVFFAKDDAEALGRVLSELASDPERVRRVAGACRARALRCFAAARMGAEYMALYEELIRAKRGCHAA